MAAVEGLEAALTVRTTGVEAALERALDGGAPIELHEAANHLVAAGGKRLRPALVLLAAEAVDPDVDHEGLLPAAIALELIHTLSLVHDDVIDDDDLRRGVPSVHVAYDASTAIVAGDLLYARAFELLGQADASAETRLACTDILARACRQLSEGQARDLRFTHDDGEAAYLRAIEGKTGALFAAAMEIGARLAGAEDAVAEALAGYGRALGVAFQLRDDVLDVTATTGTLGKPVGSDLAGGKPTLVTVHARRQGVDVMPRQVDQEGVAGVRDRLVAAGSIDYVADLADEYVGMAIGTLEVLPTSPARATLTDLARFAVERER